MILLMGAERRLLYFASDFGIGLSVLLTDELIALVNAGIPIKAVSGDGSQEVGLREKLSKADVDIVYYEGFDRHDRFLAKARYLRRLMTSEDISVVHVQNNWQLALVAYAKILLKRHVDIVYTMHGYRHNRPIKAMVAKIVIGTALKFFADTVRCTSSYTRAEFSWLGNKINVLPLGVTDRFYTRVLPKRKYDRIHALFPAQFRQGKNHKLIINAFLRYIIDSGDDRSCLVLPGDGPLRDEICHLVSDLGLQDQVLLPGRCSKDEVIDMYRDANLAIIPTNCETFGQCIAESVASGICVVTRKVGVAEDVISDGVNGYYFDSEYDLYKVLMRLGNNPEMLKITGDNNLKFRDMFSWSEIATQYKSKIWRKR